MPVVKTMRDGTQVTVPTPEEITNLTCGLDFIPDEEAQIKELWQVEAAQQEEGAPLPIHLARLARKLKEREEKKKTGKPRKPALRWKCMHCGKSKVSRRKNQKQFAFHKVYCKKARSKGKEIL